MARAAEKREARRLKKRARATLTDEAPDLAEPGDATGEPEGVEEPEGDGTAEPA